MQSPLAIAAWVLVFFEVLSLTLAMIDQYPAWTVGRSNLEALTGKTCGLANDVMVEQDPNAAMLAPVGVPIGDALDAVTAEGFGPNGIPSDVSADPVMEPPGGGSFVESDDDLVTSSEAGTEGGTTVAAGVNGSRARLPYALDPARTPVMGSWRSGTQQPAVLRSAWYQLPPRDQAGPLLVVSAAGRFDPGDVIVQWAGDDGESAGGIGFARRGRGPSLAQPAGAAGCDTERRARRSAWSPPTTIYRRHTGSRSRRRGSRSYARCRRWSVRRIRCYSIGWSAWRSRASARLTTGTASSRRRSGGYCPTDSAPKPTRR